MESFLERRISFTTIPSMIEEVMQRVNRTSINTLDDILEVDSMARATAYQWLLEFSAKH